MLKKLFCHARKEAPGKTALTNSLLEQKLARLARYKSEILSWEATRARILGDLQQRQRALKQELTQLQEVEDPAKKRYMMKSLLQRWRDNDLTLEAQRQEMNSRITTLAAQFTIELSVLAPNTPGPEDGDKAKLVNGTVLVTIEALIGIYERLDDTQAKPDLARAIGALIDTAAALDFRSVQAHAQIVRFRKELAYLLGGGGMGIRKIMPRHVLRQQSQPARRQQPHRPLDE